MTQGLTIRHNRTTWHNHVIEHYVKVTESEKYCKEESCHHTYNASPR